MPVDLAIVVHELSIGGTAKTAVNHALAHDRDRVTPRVVETFDCGDRAPELEAAGIPVACAYGDERRMGELLAGADIVHVHRPGAVEPIVPAAVRLAGVPLFVETNVFGQFDPSPDEAQFACHLFPSQMCALRYQRVTGVPMPSFAERHRVSYNPIDVGRLTGLAPAARDAKLELGLDPDRPVVGRIGRADDRKWAPIVIDMVPRLARLVPDVQMLLVGVTPAKRRLLRKRRALERTRILEPTGDERLLATYYAACDVLVSASSIGESFGVSIAEAMTLGKPVVTTSTPWVDNAQVEVIDPGVTGHLANHPQPFAEAVADLLRDEARRVAFGEAGAAKARRLWDVGPLTRQLEGLYEHLVRHGATPPGWMPSAEEFAAFPAEYERRSAHQFRPLTRREALEARAAVVAERAGWLARDVVQDPRRRLGPTLVMARRRLSARARRR
jgi:glycosyltransferase involved in cell wall biosynthesis